MALRRMFAAIVTAAALLLGVAVAPGASHGPLDPAGIAHLVTVAASTSGTAARLGASGEEHLSSGATRVRDPFAAGLAAAVPTWLLVLVWRRRRHLWRPALDGSLLAPASIRGPPLRLA